MFYSQFILAKKGPLGTIWIAAHLERKLRKNQVADTDIGVSVDSILFPEVPIALRLSSHLLLGVVRIYSKKVNYLFDDCSEALLKVKQAFRSAAVDLPPEQSKAPYHSITLPETFDLDDFELPDNEIFQGNFVDHHVSTREQITLQDTMDGVAFPTSQFGPDERFGDGDMSQIGLDLEEELLLHKGEAGGTSGNSMDIDQDPQTVDKTSLSKLVGHSEGVFPSVCSPGNCFGIQAPSTPGLMEEPNLSTAQDALVSDEHIEEDHNLSELTAKEVFGTASSQPEPSHFNDSEFNVTENGVLLDEPVKEITKSPEDEPSSKTLEFHDQPPSDEHFGAADGPHSINNELIITEAPSKEQWKANDIATNEIGVLPEGDVSLMEVDNCDTCTVSHKTDLNGSLHTSTDSKSETHNLLDGSAIFGSLEPGGLTSNGSVPQDAGQSCLNSGNTDGLESGVDKRVVVSSVPFLRACTSNAQQACNGVAASILQAEDGSQCSVVISGNGEAANFSKVQADEIPEVSGVENSDVDGQPVNLTGGRFEMENGTRFSDLSAPEKLLSMPSPPAGHSDNFLNEFTPGKDNCAEDNGDATGEGHISGRKRSFTESTLTLQSINSTETSGFAQSKGSVEFLPDDDDLLSSILVGRKSMGLKMKPTPPIAYSAPSKRQRVSVRSTALKRKVLVDDSMVLHGDTIRQQLTTTEDIRRIRKKAPCTHLEIWMLQKHFLEDEIFNEPVLTGVSPALRCLHNETFHLTRIRIVPDDTSNVGKEAEASPRPTCGEEPQMMDDTVASSVREDREQEHAGILENSCQHESALGLHDDAKEKNARVVDEELGREGAEYDISVGLEQEHRSAIDNGVLEADEVNRSCIADAAYTSAADPVTEINGTATDVPAVEPSYLRVTDEAVASPFNDASYQLLDNTTAEDAYREENSAGLRDQEEVDVSVPGKIDSYEGSDGNALLEKEEGIETAVGILDMQGNSPLPAHDIGFMDPVCPGDETYQTTAQFTKECDLDQSPVENKDELPASDLGHDSSNIATNDLHGDDIKLDCLHPEQDDLCQTEREDSERLRADPDNFYDSMGVSTNFTDADIRTDAIEHDTDFLNVDDDDVTEDYEGDMPNTEENRVLDNSGWSSRTRMVANYLQVLFEKEPQHAKKPISLGSLLAGKTRKEASRMFFETLVLTTKDYIHAEQEISFGDIHVMPQGKLLKSDF